LACARVQYWAAVNCELVNASTVEKTDSSLTSRLLNTGPHIIAQSCTLMMVWATSKTLSEMFDGEQYSTCTAVLSSTFYHHV